MRELSPEIAEQLRAQLDRAAAGRPARTFGDGAEGERAGSAREGVIEAMFLLAAVDGRVTPLEVAQFADGIEAAFGEAEDDVEALVARLAERLAAEGWDKRLGAVKSALAGTEHAETAYRLAAAVAFVDDTIEHAEAAALEALGGALGVGSDRAQAILREVRAELFGA